MAVTSLRVAGALLLALIANAALLSVLLVQNASRHSAHHSDNINDNALELIYHKEGDVGSYSNLVSGGGKAAHSTTGRVMGAARDVQTQKVLLSGATRADSNGGVRSVKDMSADNIGSGGVKKVVHVLSRSQRSTILKVADTGRYLNDVIASLTSAELQSLEPGVAKVSCVVGYKRAVRDNGSSVCDKKRAVHDKGELCGVTDGKMRESDEASLRVTREVTSCANNLREC